jgi:pimeloyl-ACP methyl ester carboxylesterase
MTHTPSDSAVPQLIRLGEGDGAFDVTLLPAALPSRVVLFAVGGGGNPLRHLPLLAALAASGCTVVAPHHDRLITYSVSDSELLERHRRLRGALESLVPSGLPMAGVGHSLGTALLLALAGGQMWTQAGRRLSIAPEPRLDRLALLAPATDFFQVPGALEAVRTPIIAWAGTQDLMTPPAQAARLKAALQASVPVDVKLVEGAGHFSFMNELPPGVTDSLSDREAFLADLATAVGRFVTS